MIKKKILFFLLLGFGIFIGAQEYGVEQEYEEEPEQEELRNHDSLNQDSRNQDSLNQDSRNLDSYSDSLCDDPPEEDQGEPEETAINLRDKVLLEASYGFIAGFAPGWSEMPWYSEYREFREYSYILGARMEAQLSMTIPLTQELLVKNTFAFALPDEAVFSIKEFYFEYDLIGRAFLQAGLYEIAWGISRFYPFTNLPARVPPSLKAGEAFTGRLKIPIQIGGLELLAMTRSDYMEDSASPTAEEIAYGGKYNLAFDGADIDMGFFYFKEMPLRFFVSLKTTLGNTELYSEGLAAVSHETREDPLFSGNFGFVRDFFKGKLTLMGEVFYNGESGTAWWRQKNELLEDEVVDFYKGFNYAAVFIIRPGILGMRIFSQALSTQEEKSIWLIPGISIKPGDITITLSAPMALGERRDLNDESNYYRKNTDKNNRPFSIVLGISYSGKLRYIF
jgi:hypothetical protein